MAATASIPALEDARNLGWKLAATLQGWGGERLLESYDAERRPVFASTMRDFIAKSIEADREFLDAHDPARDKAAFEQAWQARAQGAVGEVHAFEPTTRAPTVVWGSQGRAPSAKGSHRFDARAGHHLAPAMLDAHRNVFDELGQGFALLDLGASSEAVEAFRTAAAARRSPWLSWHVRVAARPIATTPPLGVGSPRPVRGMDEPGARVDLAGT